VAQTYRKFEWVCVDDCSTDDTVERLARLPAPGELGMQVYRLSQNTGGPVAVAHGVQCARGETVLIFDHDDELLPGALDTIASSWSSISEDESLSGLMFPVVEGDSRRVIGNPVVPGTRISTTWLSNHRPDVSDATFVFKGSIAKGAFTIQNTEALALFGVILNEITAEHPVAAKARPVRVYHRDNPASQTRLERISRKTVASYARLLDQADLHYLRSPVRWVRHGATLLRYSKQVHGRWFEGLHYIRRPGIRLLVRALWPLGLLAYWRRPRANVVDIPLFRPEQAEGLPNLWQGSA
jgi:glycosyltransferase involved in cell wall biosynthesis